MTLLLTETQKLQIAARRMREMARVRTFELQLYALAGIEAPRLATEIAALNREAAETDGLEAGC
jgi:hypothetical protein